MDKVFLGYFERVRTQCTCQHNPINFLGFFFFLASATNYTKHLVLLWWSSSCFFGLCKWWPSASRRRRIHNNRKFSSMDNTDQRKVDFRHFFQGFNILLTFLFSSFLQHNPSQRVQLHPKQKLARSCTFCLRDAMLVRCRKTKDARTKTCCNVVTITYLLIMHLICYAMITNSTCILW